MIQQKLYDIILEAYKRSFAVQSDFARSYATYVAMAASMGLISTKVHQDIYSGEWRPTVKGLTWLEKRGVTLTDDEWSSAPLEHEADVDEEA